MEGTGLFGGKGLERYNLHGLDACACANVEDLPALLPIGARAFHPDLELSRGGHCDCWGQRNYHHKSPCEYFMGK